MENQIAKLDPVGVKELSGYLDVMGLTPLLTDKEKIQFLEISQAFGLNPFKREVYCSKYGSQMSIIVGYETYIKRAERSGQLDGWQVVTEGKIEDNSLKAIITIHRKDRKIPFVHEVYYSEYVQKTKEGQVTKFWQKTHTMIKKVAMAQGFRLCFSDELGGMPYSKEEMPETEEVKHEDVTANVTSAINILKASTTIEELQKSWALIGSDLQRIHEVLHAKNEMKDKLLPDESASAIPVV